VEKKYSNESLQTNEIFGAFAANIPTEAKLIGARPAFLQPDNNFRALQTQGSDLRDQGCLLSSTVLRVEDRAEILIEERLQKAALGKREI